MRKRAVNRVVSWAIALSMILQPIPFGLLTRSPNPVDASAPTATNASTPTGLTPAAQIDGVTVPDVLAYPISISRVQSQYTGGSAVVITYTVTNNQLPIAYPIVPPEASVEETLALTDGFDPTADPNTLRDVLLTTALTSAATLVTAVPAQHQSGASLAWTLGDIAPGQSAEAVLTVSGAGSATAFTDLDEGATAWGTLQGRAVSAQAAPARLAPEELAQWLIWTVDADLYDAPMLAQAAELGQDPAALFAFVRDLGYEAYTGSLRGTGGTLWSGAGNAVDQASLLIAMLRASGIPARYRHGTLATADAQTLIASMFPTPTQFAGYVPPEATVADPVNDAALITETADHWWVEAYLPDEGWVNLDPAFAGASVGQTFAAPAGDGTDRIAELPDVLRHKVRIRLKVEDYHPLNLGGGGLEIDYPMDVTLNTAAIATQPVAFSHLVDTQGQPGMVFTNIIHTYTPYLLIGDETILGNAYQDIFTNFPLGTVFHTGVWLTFEIQHPDGSSESREREIVDRIGAAARMVGGEVPLDLEVGTDSPPLVTAFDIYTTGFWPNLVPPQTLAHSRAAALASLPALNADAQRLQALDAAASLSAEEETELREIRARFQRSMARYLGDVSVTFAEAADRLLVDTQAGVFVRAYYDSPRVVTVGVQPGEGITPTFTLDLRTTAARVLPYPGQAESAAFGFNMVKGIVESGLEGAALSSALGQTALTTARLFEAATEQGIATTIVTADNLARLEGLTISDEAKARITAAALEGKILLVPQAPVQILDGGHTGWWEVDAITGETIGVMENGLHLAALEYLLGIGAGSIIGGPMTDFILGFTSYTLGFVADRVDKAIGEGTFDLDAYLSNVSNVGTAATCLSSLASIIFTFDVWSAGNCGAGLAGAATGDTTDFFGLGQVTAKNYLASVVQYDPPVPQNWQAVAPPETSEARASAAVSVTSATGARNLNAALTTGDVTVFGEITGAWTAPAQQTYPVSSLSASGTLQDSGGTAVGGGAVSASPLSGATFDLTASPTDVALTGEGRMSFYAPALTGIGSGARWASYSATLDGVETLGLRAATATLNGVTRTGDFTIETDNPADVTGEGSGAAPNYANATTLQLTAARVRLGPASGTATADGAALDVTNGLAVAGVTGALAITEQSATTDQVTLQDNVDFFTLNLTPLSSSITPQTSAVFQSAIYANFTDVYTLTATAPAGWDVTVSGSGAITAAPPTGAAPGDYAVLVTAQSSQYPGLILSAIHTVTVGSYDGFDLDVAPDATFTVPMGPVRDPNAVTGSTNTGEAQIPGAAYTITIVNQANETRTYAIGVSGLPGGWTQLSRGGRTTNTSLTLPAGARGMVGLYIDPDTDALPAPGEAFNFTVTVESDSGLSDSASRTFTMPAVPFSYVTVDPPMHYLARNTEATVEVGITNVGNAPGGFPLTSLSAIPTIALIDPLQSSGTLNPGETFTQTVTLAVGEAPLGQLFPFWFSSAAPDGVYTQTQATHVWVTAPPVDAILQAAQCDAGSATYRDSVYSLATAVSELQRWCETGDCPLPLRDQAVAAGEAIVTHARHAAAPITLPTLGALEDATADLATQTTDDEIMDAVDALSAALTTVGEELCQVGAYGVGVRFRPTLQAARLGEPVTFTLTVTNRGTLTTTTAITVTGIPGGELVTDANLAPGASAEIPLSFTPTALGVMELTAKAAPVIAESALDLSRTAAARLNVVDRFIQVTAVRADPAFVETGISNTTLQAEIANIAGVGLGATATATALAPDGTEQWQETAPLNILGGAPRTYDLATIDTSGWAAGVYTLTVNAQLSAPYTEGSENYGYLSVGQGVVASHAVSPELVAPGTVTVTTTITAAISDPGILAPAATESVENETSRTTIYTAPMWGSIAAPDSGMSRQARTSVDEDTTTDEAPVASAESPPDEGEDLREAEAATLTDEATSTPLTFDHTALPTPSLSELQNQSIDTESSVALDGMGRLQVTIGGFTRTEQDDPAITYGGSWTQYTVSRASGGSYVRGATAGQTATMAFDGTWLNVGFIGSPWGGIAEIAIDGASQGLFDLYRRESTMPLSFAFDGLGAGSHTVVITVTGDSRAWSQGTRVELDYIDAWDGTPLGDARIENGDPRVLTSGGWVTVTHASASGGSYGRGSSVSAWFPFDGDSLTYHAIAYNLGNRADLFVDGAYLDTVDLYHPNNATNAVTRTFSYAGFGSGPHILQITSYRGQTTLDALETPGASPYTDPNPAPGSINRYEEDHPAHLYNDVPYTETVPSWSRQNNTTASDGQYLRSATADDVFSFDFEGSWANLGFVGDRFSGRAEILVDGESQGIVDLYRREETPIDRFFGDLGPGTHTLSVTVLGESNPNAGNTRVQIDFVEFGDGTGLDDGTFEENDARVLLGGAWTTESNADASGGTFIRTGSQSAWFHFEGDSFTYHAMAYNSANRARLTVDGAYLDTVDLYHPNNHANAITRTFSYAGFGPGPHVLQISAYRSNAALDALTTPGTAPFVDLDPPVTGITRFEEDHPTIRYNGVPYTQTAQSWNRVDNLNSNRASDGQIIHAAAAGDTISFDFEGSWIGVGFATDRFSGQAEIAIDGAPIAEVDLYTRENDTESFYFDNLGAGPHTLTITVLGTQHPNAINSHVYLDYIDVWDGAPLPEGAFEETDPRIIYSNGWGQVTNAGASGGSFASGGGSDTTAWFPFTGDSVTLEAWRAASGYHSVEIKIDGISQGTFNTYSYTSEPHAFSFDGLGDGPHVLEVRKYRGASTIDALHTPATGAPAPAPAPTGIIRLEEDHPDLRYNGYPLRTMPQSWSTENTLRETSGGHNARTGTAGNTLSLDFEGSWVGVGFRSASWSGVAEIFIDGVSRGTFDTADSPGGIASVYYDDLVTGSHTISVTAVSGTVMPDFIDIWDGETLDDGWYNASLDDDSGRFHYSNKNWWGQVEEFYAHEGDYVRQSLVNANPNIWLTFVGSDLTLLTRTGNAPVLDITIDGEHYGEFTLSAEYSGQPYALHFPDLGDGPHVLQIHTRNWGSIDAFEVNPADFYAYTPQVTWHDNTAKESIEGAAGTGFLTTIGIGDLDGDGIVELVAPGRNGRLYVYRGDGADTGDGTPILWTSDLVGPAAEPALADLTGDGTAEIVVSGRHGTFAFRHDGLLLWENLDVVSYYAGEDLGWGGPTIGNLDADPEPEIAIAASEDGLYVLDHEGNILASDPIPGRWPTTPILADITGDGTLDIITAQGHTLWLYEYDALNGLEIAWSYTLTNTTLRSGAFGTPAVADLTGDGQPEIVINWGHRIEALRADGSVLWSTYTGNDAYYRPSPITVADVTGDGEINLITASAISSGFLASNHMLMVYNADGTLVWEQTVADNTASASGVAAQDLTGNGVWEILWNGATDGFLIIRGPDGKRLFNEPFTGSGTIVEYPSMGDVDGDGVADVVVAGREGIFVISHVGRWIDSRPMWNQHNYHVTNINDDWSVPQTQPDSWTLHNTYRTQTPERAPAPAYRVELTHTVGLTDVTVIPTSFSTPPTGTPPDYRWETQLEWYAPVYTVTLASELADLQPGESRQINQGTVLRYRLPSGWNSLTLPPLYVTAARILAVAPVSQTVSVGNTVAYTLTLYNPRSTDDVYELSAFGLPEEMLAYPTAVNVPAQSSVKVLLGITAPPDAEPDEVPFAVTATNGNGDQDTATATLRIVNALTLALTPAAQSAPTGTATAYELTLTNHDSAAHTVSLAASGSAAAAVDGTVTIPAETSITLPVTVTAEIHGPQPFTIAATGSGGSGSVDGLLTGHGRYAVGLSLTPESSGAGPGTPAPFTLSVSNLGDRVDGYDLAVDAPAGWETTLTANGAPLDAITLPPHTFNSADLHLQVTPDVGAAPGSYAFEVTATSQARPSVATTLAGTVEVGPRGVQVSISPAQTTLTGGEEGAWQVTVTNVGSAADTYDLAATGVVALGTSFSPSSVTLAPGASQTVQMTTAAMPFVLPGTDNFQVVATSQANEAIANVAEAEVTFSAYDGVIVAWEPASQTLSGTLSTRYSLVISNTGTLPTTYQVTLDMPELTGELAINPVTVPPRSRAVVPLTVQGEQSGTYTLTATAQGGAAADSASATLTIEGVEEPDPEPTPTPTPDPTPEPTPTPTPDPTPDPDPDDGPDFTLYLPLIQR